jgi:putative effector of murein hydrolase
MLTFAVDTNVVFWVLVFALAWGLLASLRFLQKPRGNKANGDAEGQWPTSWKPESMSSKFLGPPIIIVNCSASTSRRTSETFVASAAGETFADSNRTTLVGTPEPPDAGSIRGKSPCRVGDQQKDSVQSRWSNLLLGQYPILLSFALITMVGIPLSATGRDSRILDGCMLWFMWIGSIQLQKGFKMSSPMQQFPKLKSISATLLNPVVWTTLGMTAYTMARASISGEELDSILTVFSSGTRLAELWTAHVGGVPLKSYQADWFGAGDAALSILESGIVAWGFKLFECRRELWSREGGAIFLLSISSAVLNVLVSVLLGRASGLAQPESLAFAARCTTLALARPAMQALGANEVVNAAVVVCNGIIGQLMYPYVLARLGIPGEGEIAEDDSETGEQARPNAAGGIVTVAAGATIGINGAAMGVSYLYERRSLAAPYAALSMTVFGVMTVVFTSVQPFNHLVRIAAGAV